MNEHFIVENKKYNYNMINELNNEDRLNLLSTFKMIIKKGSLQ